MTLARKCALTLVVSATLFAAAVITGYSLFFAQQADAQTAGSKFASEVRSFPSNDPATTTRQSVTAAGFTAASTFIIPTENVDFLDLRLMVEASTTASEIRWRVSFSDNYNPATGNGDWYYQDSPSVAIATTTHSVQAHEHLWIPGTVSTTTKAVATYPIMAKNTRIQFYGTAAASMLHADAVLRKNLSQ